MRDSLIVGLIILLVVSLVFDHPEPYDDTDDAANGERSGIILYTDHLTGCQYLRFGLFGGTRPRIKDNVHIGCK